MNSLVSVEEEEVSCDDSLVLNASNISGSSIESENENKLNDSNDASSDSIDSDNKSPHSNNNLLESCGSVDISLHPNVISLEQAFASSKAEKDFKGFAVDLECLGLPILLDNEVIALDNNTDLSQDIESLLLSDTESTNSFDGFTESSASSFEGFVQRNYDTAIEKDNSNQSIGLLNSSIPSELTTLISNRPRPSTRLKGKNKNPTVFHKKGRPIHENKYILPLDTLDTIPLKRKRGRPPKSISSPSLHQNSFESLNNTFHISSTKKSQKAVNGVNGVGEQRQSKEKTLLNLNERKNLAQHDLFSSDSDSNGSSEEEIFEGFSDIDLSFSEKKLTKVVKKHLNKNDPIDSGLNRLRFRNAAEVETADSKKKCKLENAHDEFIHGQEDLSDFIGYNCNAIGCTINWLESSKIRSQPVPINNGVVYELHEFARKINWESRYIAIWILRLRGYNVVDISDEDLDKINLILRRRKALTTIFAGKQLCKSKINAFDKAEFLLPTAGRLDYEKNLCDEVSKNTGDKDDSCGLPPLIKNEKNFVLSNKTIHKGTQVSYSSRQSHDDLEINKQKECSKSSEVVQINYCLDQLKFATEGSERPSGNIKKPSDDIYMQQPLSTHTPNETYPLRRRSQLRSKGYMKNDTLRPALIDEQESYASKRKVPVQKYKSELPHYKELLIKNNLLAGNKKVKGNNTVNKETSYSKDWQIAECGLLKDTESSKYDSMPISSSSNKKNSSSSLTLRSRTKSTNKEEENCNPNGSKLTISNGEEVVFDNLKFENNKLSNVLQKPNALKLPSKDDFIGHTTNKSNSVSDNTNLLNHFNNALKSNNVSPGEATSTESNLCKDENIFENSHEILPENKYIKSFSDNYVSSKGRLLKPTIKIQDLYNDKNMLLNSIVELESSSTNKTDLVNKSSQGHSIKNSHSVSIKTIQNIFVNDGNIIGKHCNEAGITIKLINSHAKSMKPITNGIVYELYHFFKLRNAKLTTLVHTIYRLKDIPIEKAPIISTMAKIHELVKVVWEEQILANPNMPYNEFEVGICSYYTTQKSQTCDTGKENEKRKAEQDSSTHMNDQGDINKDAVKKVTNNVSSNKNENRIFDLNATKGQVGKITKGDIVYVYTRWLKKKMEGQVKVFVTDLSNDVENLIAERKVEAMRVPVGALMSSSVKLFEKFRKLSKINMQNAKAYLLEDWIQDIQELLNPNQSLKNVGNDDSKLVPNSSQLSDPENHLDKDAVNDKFKSDDSVHLKTTQSKCSLPEKAVKVADINKTSTLDLPVVVNSESKISASELPVVIDSEAESAKHVEHDVGKSAKILCEYHPEIEKKRKLEIPEKKIAEEYEVEKIVGYRIVRMGEESATEFRVRWVGFTSEEDSWVNVDDLQCPDRLTEFWDALNKQRALKNSSKNLAANNPCIETSVVDPPIKSQSVDDNKICLSSNVRKEVEDPHDIFIPMICSLKPSLIDYQYDEEGPIPKRVRVSKGEILSIFDNWCQKNQEKLKTSANIPVDVDVLISRVMEFMDKKKVRNFNPNCIFDVCFRMSLMKLKLQDSSKLIEYLSGDVMDLIESSRRHQEFVRIENVNKIKNYKIQVGRDDDIEKKIKNISKFEKESLLIANYIEEHGMKANFEDMLKEDISWLKKVLSLAISNHDEINSTKTMEALKNKSESTIQELKNCGIKDKTIDELIKIVLKST